MTSIHSDIAFLLFVISLAIMMWYNHQLLKSADKRLKMANEMVLTLASSADKLSESVKELKGMMVHMQNVREEKEKELSNNRDEIMSAYKKLLAKHQDLQSRFDELQSQIMNKYSRLSDDLFRTVQEIARKPTITNQN